MQIAKNVHIRMYTYENIYVSIHACVCTCIYVYMHIHIFNIRRTCSQILTDEEIFLTASARIAFAFSGVCSRAASSHTS